MNRLSTQLVRTLRLPHGHLSAASGITRVGDKIQVVPDDGKEIGVFDVHTTAPGSLHTVIPGPPLPEDEKERKKLKPDLESMCLVDHQGGKAMLALGSGSKENRQRGVFQSVDAQGELTGEPKLFDLSGLYGNLPYKELNIEGVAASGKSLRLAQRGNSQEGINAILELDLEGALKAIEEDKAWGPELILNRTEVQLPKLDGVPLTLTDLTAVNDELTLFSAAAEDTENTYDDGEIVGSALGLLNSDGDVVNFQLLDRKVKVEGVDAQIFGDGLQVVMVTDNDDPHKPAEVLRADWSDALRDCSEH